MKLIAADAEAFDLFGLAVSVDGDTALVGAIREDPNDINDAGSASVFVRSNGTWSQQVKLVSDDAGAGDFFGRSVSVDGETGLVGAYREDPDGILSAWPA